MILNAIKETIKENNFLKKYLSEYFKITQDFSEDNLLKLYKTGADLGGTCIEDSLMLGLKNDEENFDKVKSVLNIKTR